VLVELTVTEQRYRAVLEVEAGVPVTEVRHPASDATCRRGSAGRLTHDTAGPEKAPTDQAEMCAWLVVLPGQNDD
jgi:hypothetical protein